MKTTREKIEDIGYSINKFLEYLESNRKIDILMNGATFVVLLVAVYIAVNFLFAMMA